MTFFIGIPVVLAVVFLDMYNHLPLNLMIVAFSAFGCNEFHDMLTCAGFRLMPKGLLIALTSALPLLSYIFAILGLSLEIVPWIFVLAVIFMMGYETLTQRTFEDSLKRIALSVLVVFYCGLLITFISRMTVLDDSVYFIAMYFLFVFMCDSAAWLFGNLFGKGNRGIVAASPNKSIAGFAGGIAASVLCGILAWYIFPEIFEGGVWRIILLGFTTSVTGITGDLIESVFKRSANCKDSGKMIPGRGGVLDSIDSLVVAAPVYYVCIHFLYS